jgi:RNA polymerase-interacting CarD/CdnL/TRCF family regulator
VAHNASLGELLDNLHLSNKLYRKKKKKKLSYEKRILTFNEVTPTNTLKREI